MGTTQKNTVQKPKAVSTPKAKTATAPKAATKKAPVKTEKATKTTTKASKEKLVDETAVAKRGVDAPKAKRGDKNAKAPAKPLRIEAKAVAKNVHSTPRKIRLVMGLVRNKDVVDAMNILNNTNKIAVVPVMKLIRSAYANAVNNFNLDGSKLYIYEIYATDGMKLKRYIPRAKGSASGLVKRWSHIYVTLRERGEK